MKPLEYPDIAPAPDRLTAAAYAIAVARRRSEHGQHCPVWTRRTRNAAIDKCDCWILRNAHHDALRALKAASDHDEGVQG